MERSDLVDGNMIEDMMNNEHGHREQASVSVVSPFPSAVDSSTKVRRDTVTDPLYKTNCSLEDYLALERRKELAVEEVM